MQWSPTTLAIAAFAVTVTCATLVALRLDAIDVESERVRTLDMTGDHAHALQEQVERSLSATSALAALVRQGSGTIRDFESLAAEMLPYYRGASALQLAPRGVITQIYPAQGNEGAFGHDLLSDPARNREAFLARDSGVLTLAGPFPLTQGGLGAVGRLPVFLDDEGGRKAFWGFTTVLLRFPETLVPARLPHLTEMGYRYELWRKLPETGERQVIAVGPAGPPQDPVERTVAVPNATWTLSVEPIAGWGNSGRRWLMAGWSLLLSVLLAYHVKILFELQAHRRGLESLVARRTAEVREREADLNRAQSIARIGNWVSEGSGTLRGSDEACRIFGFAPGSAVSVDQFLERVHPEDRDAVIKAREKALRGEPCEIEFRVVVGGEVRWVNGRTDAASGPPSEARRIVSAVQDITERKQAEADLRVAAAAFEAKEGMIVTDANGVILRVNRTCTEITGYSPNEAVGRTPAMFKSGRQDDAFYASMWRAVKETGAWQGEIWNRRKSGEIYPEWLGITAVRNNAGKVTNYIGTLSDITQRKAAEAEIERLAFYDAITGLPNRRLLHDRLQRALVTSARKHRQGALLFIDLDDFKTLNDTQGHEVGDVLLRHVAERLSGCVRGGDTVARLGGDEYVVMLEELGETRQEAANQTESIGEMILARLGVPYGLAAGAYHQTASIGIVLYGGATDTVDELLRGADLAMYRAKEAGGNTLRFFDPEMQGTVTSRARIVSDLREGLRNGEFRLAYQPQVDLDGRLLGAEALLRWHSATRGPVSPLDFIPIAEQTGLIVPIGQWVLERACDQLARWSEEPDRVGLTLSVNVSAREFRHAEFVERTLAVLVRTRADPRKLMIEVTESVLLDDLEGAVSTMATLRERGVRFSLDDFGTGYSSLAYLKHLPVEQLKIDKSFVHDVLANPSDAMIARAIVALAKSLGLTVVAEGVETQAQWKFLVSHGCHAFQGYYFGAPGTVDALPRG